MKKYGERSSPISGAKMDEYMAGLLLLIAVWRKQRTGNAHRGHLGDIALPCGHFGQAIGCLSCLPAASTLKGAVMCAEKLSGV